MFMQLLVANCSQSIHIFFPLFKGGSNVMIMIAITSNTHLLFTTANGHNGHRKLHKNSCYQEHIFFLVPYKIQITS